MLGVAASPLGRIPPCPVRRGAVDGITAFLAETNRKCLSLQLELKFIPKKTYLHDAACT